MLSLDASPSGQAPFPGAVSPAAGQPQNHSSFDFSSQPDFAPSHLHHHGNDELGLELVSPAASVLGPAPIATSPPPRSAGPLEPLFGDLKGPVDQGDVSTASSIFNLANTIIGTGALTMSWVCMQSGFLLFVALVAAMGWLSDLTLMKLIRSLRLLGRRNCNYAELGRLTYGRRGELLASWCVTIQQLGAAVAYIVIVADVMVPVLKLSGAGILGSRAFVQAVLALTVVLPLCMLRTMKALSGVSLASLVAIICFILAVLFSGLYIVANPEKREELERPDAPEPELTGDFRWLPKGPGFISGLPLLAFAFLCHQNSFPIYSELRAASVNKMARVSHVSVMVCGLGYLLVGLAGYLIFLDHTDAGLLNNFRTSGNFLSTPINIVRMGFGVCILLSYPIIVFEARTNLDKLIFGPGRPYELKRALTLNVCIVGGTTLLGILAPGIGTVIGLVGSTGSPLMAFIFPSCFYMKAMELCGIDTSFRTLFRTTFQPTGPSEEQSYPVEVRGDGGPDPVLERRLSVFCPPGEEPPTVVPNPNVASGGFFSPSPTNQAESLGESPGVSPSNGVAAQVFSGELERGSGAMPLRRELVWDDNRNIRYRLWQSWLTLGFGVVMIPLCLTMWVIDLM